MKVYRRRRLIALLIIALWILAVAAIVWLLWLLDSVLIVLYS